MAEEEECKAAVKVNGRYISHWRNRDHSPFSFLRWAFWEKNDRGIIGTWRNLYRLKTKELDENLPVLKPNTATLNSPPNDAMQVTWIGHATVLVQMDGFNIITDPVFNSYVGPTHLTSMKRYRPAPCTVGELPAIDAVCISHDHYDHLDYTTVLQFQKEFGRQVRWFVPKGLSSWMEECGCENVIDLEWWEEMECVKQDSNGNPVTCKFAFTPAQHWCRRSLRDENKVLWGSWCITGTKHKFFFAGDTGYCSVFKQIGKKYGPFDFAAIPIGAYQPRWFLSFQHVDPAEAVSIHQDVQSHCSLGIHWGTFPTGREHYLAPPKDLSEALQSQQIPMTNFFTLKHGETKVIGTHLENETCSSAAPINNNLDDSAMVLSPLSSNRQTVITESGIDITATTV